MDQKLWDNQKLRRCLGRAGMCWTQPPRVDYIFKKMWAGGRREILAMESLGHLRKASERPAVRSLGPANDQ
jgi:hypothetical protein